MSAELFAQIAGLSTVARGGARRALPAFVAWLCAALFRLHHAVHALRDRAAALRNRLPGAPQMPASTIVAYGAVGIMTAIFVNDLMSPTPAESSVEIPELRPHWFTVARPYAAFALDSRALDGLAAAYVVRRHREGGGRKDELTFGDPLVRRPYVRVVLHRPGSAGVANPDPLEAVAGVAAESSIDAELRESDRTLNTKFGPLPIVAMTVKGRDGTRRCLAAASGWNDPNFGLVAWWCNAGPELVPQGQFACLIDRIALISAGGDDRLAEFFADAELRRGHCRSHGTIVSPTPKRPDDWIYAKRGPRLRGRMVER